MPLYTKTAEAFLMRGMTRGGIPFKTGFAPLDIKTAKATGRRPMRPKRPAKKRGR